MIITPFVPMYRTRMCVLATRSLRQFGVCLVHVRRSHPPPRPSSTRPLLPQQVQVLNCNASAEQIVHSTPLPSGITAVITPARCILSFTGATDPAKFATALRGVKYRVAAGGVGVSRVRMVKVEVFDEAFATTEVSLEGPERFPSPFSCEERNMRGSLCRPMSNTALCSYPTAQTVNLTVLAVNLPPSFIHPLSPVSVNESLGPGDAITRLQVRSVLAASTETRANSGPIQAGRCLKGRERSPSLLLLRPRTQTPTLHTVSPYTTSPSCI